MFYGYETGIETGREERFCRQKRVPKRPWFFAKPAVKACWDLASPPLRGDAGRPEEDADPPRSVSKFPTDSQSDNICMLHFSERACFVQLLHALLTVN